MKMPATPPNFNALFKDISNNPEILLKLLDSSSAVDYKGRYLHWDKIKYLETNLEDKTITKEFF